MEILIESTGRLAPRSRVSAASSPLHRARSLRTALKKVVLFAGLGTAASGLAWGTDSQATVDSEATAQAQWRTFMAQNPMPAAGCFHASYPSTAWQRVDCQVTPPRVHPTPVRSTGGDKPR